MARTWAEAKSICETLGGHLATSTSAEKNAFLVSLIGNNTVWIGGTDKDNEGSWQWITGEGWSYTNWNSGEPNNSGDEDYIELMSSGKWNDNKSTTSHCYICEWDYVLDENNFPLSLWQNIAVASIGSETICGFLPAQADALSGRACFKSADGRILLPENGEFLTLSENNAQLFFDALSHKGLLLDDNGGQLMLGEGLSDAQNVNCKTLSQWLAPAGMVDAVADDYIVASADNSAFCTSLVTGFNRQFLSPNSIPLTAKVFQDSKKDYYRLAISEGVNENNRKAFGVNKILAQNVTPEAIQWQNIYKEPVKFELLHSFSVSKIGLLNFYSQKYDAVIDNIYSGRKEYSAYPIFLIETCDFITPVETTYSTNDDGVLFVEESLSGKEISIYDDDYLNYECSRSAPYNGKQFAVPTRATAKIFFIHPDTGQPSIINLNISCKCEFISGSDDTAHYTEISYFEVPSSILIRDNQIVWACTAIDYSRPVNDGRISAVFKPCMTIPAEVSDWYDFGYFYQRVEGHYDTNLPITSLQFKEFADNYAVFFERVSNTYFLQQFSLEERELEAAQLYWFLEFPCLLNKYVHNDTIPISTRNLHIFCFQKYVNDKSLFFILVFRSEIYPEIFDFPAEAERSKSH